MPSADYIDRLWLTLVTSTRRSCPDILQSLRAFVGYNLDLLKRQRVKKFKRPSARNSLQILLRRSCVAPVLRFSDLTLSPIFSQKFMEPGASPGQDSNPGLLPKPSVVDEEPTLSGEPSATAYVTTSKQLKQHRYEQPSGLWYPPTAFVFSVWPAPPPPPPPGSKSATPPPPPPKASTSSSQPQTSTPTQQWYHDHPPTAFSYSAEGFSSYAHGHSPPSVGGYMVPHGHYGGYTGPYMVVPQGYHQQQAHIVQPSNHGLGFFQCIPQEWSESQPECFDHDSESDSGSCCSGSHVIDCKQSSPNYVVDPSRETDYWSNMTVSIFQNIFSKLAESDAKNVRLVNRHWRAVFDNNLETLTPSVMMSKLIVLRFPHLKALHLTNCSHVRNQDLVTITSSGMRLHTLTLGDGMAKPWVTNKGVACISKITSLTSLNLQDCKNVTNNGMVALNKLSYLEALSLKGCQKLTSTGLEALQSNTALTSLNLFGCLRMGDKGLLSLSNLNLLTLTLGCTKVKDEGLSYLAKMTSLQELHFEREDMTDVGIKTLSSLTNLQSLALRDCGDVSGDSLSHLIPQLPNLQSLDLYKNFSIDDSQLSKCLEFLGSVTFLDLRGTFVTEGGLSELTRLSSLQRLCLAPSQENADVYGEYMCVISNLTQLTSLTINNCQLVSFPLAKSLRQLTQLRVLDLSDEEKLEVSQKPPVNQAAVDVMATLTSLTSIDLSRRPVHEDHLSVLAERLPKLHKLIIIGCPVLSSEVQSLQRRFPELSIHRKPLPDVSCSSSDHGSSTG
eukprot:gene6589-3243_t